MSMFLWLADNPGVQLSDADFSEDFGKLVDQSMESTSAQTREHQQDWRMGQADRWDFDQTTGKLTFAFSDGVRVTYDAQITGSYNENDRTWLWSWANSHVLPTLTKDAEVVRQHGIQNDLTLLQMPKWKSDINWAWTMTAITCALTKSEGCHSGQGGKTRTFFTFRNIVTSIHE
jgi:hypothetical protein